MRLVKAVTPLAVLLALTGGALAAHGGRGAQGGGAWHRNPDRLTASPGDARAIIDWRKLGAQPAGSAISFMRPAHPRLVSALHAAAAAPARLNGFNYVSYYNGGYVNADSLKALAKTGATAVGLNLEYGINVNTSHVYADATYTDSLKTLGRTIDEARKLGLAVMVRPLIDFLDPAKIGSYSVGDWRTYYNPKNPDAFFTSYQTMLVGVAKVAQAHGATLLSVGTELDQLTGPQYRSDWIRMITAVHDVYSGGLTYSADWDDAISPWKWGGHGLAQGTGSLATQVSFWKKMNYVGIDEYAPISDAAHPTSAQLLAGWTKVPTDATAKSVTGSQSLRHYFRVTAAGIGKPLLFTEIGYESASDAARNPAGSQTNVFDPQLQADLYSAFFKAWQNVGVTSFAGEYFWDWDPNAAEVGPGNGANFSPQNLPAQDVVEANWLPAANAVQNVRPGVIDFSGKVAALSLAADR